MNQNPIVSVLIPTYNAAAFIEEAIDSVLNQTFQDFEIVVLDNRSTDETEEIIKKYKSDGRFSFKKNSHNLGGLGNFNKIMDLSRGKYVKFLCADDKFHPQLLEKFVDIMDSFPNVSLVTSYTEEFELQSKIWPTPLQNLQPGKKITAAVLKDYNFLGSPTAVMLRKSNLHLGKFKPEFPWVADWDLWLRHLSVGDCYIVPQVLSYTRVHNQQVTASVKQSYRTYYEKYDLYKLIKNNNEYGINLSEIHFDALIKKRATELAMVVPHTVLNLRKPEARRVLKKALFAAYKEKVVLTSIRQLTKSLVKKMFPTNKD